MGTRVGAVSRAVAVALACTLVGIGAHSFKAVQAASGAPTGLHVSGNRVLDGNNLPLVLHGVNHSGTDYACAQGWGLFDGFNGDTDTQSIANIVAWHANVIRVGLNEACWLGINGVPAQYGGTNYQNAMITYVNNLNAAGLVVVLEVHNAAPGGSTALANGASGQYTEPQLQMPDADHAPTFWQQVATTFKANSSVIFDLYNEPHPDNNQDTTAAWTCWRDGGSACPGLAYTAVGMQSLITSIRNTGATNIIQLGGVQYAGTDDAWLTYEPTDPTGNLIADWHSYGNGSCITSSCWPTRMGSVSQRVPLLVNEIGDNNCTHGYIDSLMPWLDGQNIGYLAWTWNTWDCSSGPSLITDYTGTPTAYGVGFKTHLAALASTPITGTIGTSSAHAATLAFSTSVTLNQNLSNATVVFYVYDANGNMVNQTPVRNVSLLQGTPTPVGLTWPVPAGQAAGSYTLKVGVFDSTWSQLYVWKDPATTFSIT